jgi:hypothetical protein
MITKKLYFIIIILVLTSCNFLKNGAPFTPNDEDKIVFKSKNTFTDSSQVTSFECEEFVSKALSNYNIEIITKIFIFLDRTKEPVINMHEGSSYIDTVYTFSNSNNKIQVYRAKNTDFIITFDVTDPKFSLSGNVNTGITKEFFIRKFQTMKSISDNVQVSNSNGRMKFHFYFENNRLKRIKSDFYIN